MSTPEIFPLAITPLTAHAFNADRSQVAVCPNTNEVHIYSRTATGWQLNETLAEHDKLVTSIDWAPSTNRLVTCSQDRNAYVWSVVQDATTGRTSWKPTLVLLRINRAATFVRWSPNEDKFAVATGARTIAICSFEEDNNWWVAKHLKKPIRSTVLSIDWHPNNVLLAAGSADNKARVFSAYIKGIDARPAPTIWGEKLPFNTLCGEFASPSGGWVHSVAFSPSGDTLAFTSHDSSLTIVYPGGPEQPPQAVYPIRSSTLPYVTLVWTSENALVAAGHDCQPILYSGSIDQGWKYVRSLDDVAAKAAAGPGNRLGAAPVGRLNNEAFNRFRTADVRGSGGSSSTSGANADGELPTTHQNTITSIRPYEWEGTEVSKISTTGVDGRLCLFSVAGGAAALVSGMGRMDI
uniref:Actin-related protein 2/3 complex subunit n=1 Tax=Bartheletia paradoxa TaxID=669517 RepID=A0A2D0XI12_9BASI|nr:hypothetical protein SPAR03771 [Bartheletia paradoxa]